MHCSSAASRSFVAVAVHVHVNVNVNVDVSALLFVHEYGGVVELGPLVADRGVTSSPRSGPHGVIICGNDLCPADWDMIVAVLDK